MKKIAVKLTDIAQDFIKNIQIVNPSVAGNISENDVQQRKNGNIIFNNEIYKQDTVKTFWNNFAEKIILLIKKQVSRFGQNDIIYNFMMNENGKIMRNIAKDFINLEKENKEELFKKDNIIVGDKYVFTLSDESYTDEMVDQDAKDTEQEQRQEQNKLTEEEQKYFKKLEKSINITKSKIDTSLNRILKNWDEQKWQKLKEKLNNLINNLEEKKSKLNEHFFNIKPAETLLNNTIEEIKQQIEDIEYDNNVDLDVWQNEDTQEEKEQEEEKTTEQKPQKKEIQKYPSETQHKIEEQKEQSKQQTKEETTIKSDEKGIKNDSDKEEQLIASGFLANDFKVSKQKTNYCETFVKDKQLILSKTEFNKLDNSIASLVNIVRKNKWKIKVA